MPLEAHRFAGVLLAVALLAGGVVLLAGGDVQDVVASESGSAVAASALERARVIENELVSALRRVEPASVTVVRRRALPGPRRRGAPATYVMDGAGSGVLVRWNGTWVLSNAHVMKGGKRLEAVSHDGRVLEIVLQAQDEAVDLAVARIVNAPSGLRPVRLPPRAARPAGAGTWVSAAGSPFLLSLDGHPVATMGVISATRPARSDGYVAVPTIQHDAEVNPGNSGGALWSLGGDLLGINGIIATHSVGAGAGPSHTGASFAVPTEAIRAFLTKALGPEREASAVRVASAPALQALESEYRRAIEKVMPSTAVCVPRGVQGQSAGFSSGVLVDPRGLVLSDGDAGLIWRRRRVDGRFQRVRSWSREVDVRIWNPTSRRWGTWKGRVVHRDRTVDTSLVQLLETPVGGFKHFVAPGRSRTVRAGDLTLTMGSTLDKRLKGAPALTAGVISALDEGPAGFLYTSAGVNTGMNGGAVVDLDGRLIGTISMAVDASSTSPYGFLSKTVPIDRILAALRDVPEARRLFGRPRVRAERLSGGHGLESTIHRAGRRIRPALVSIEVERVAPVSTSVPLDGRTVQMTRYGGPFSGIVANSDGLVVTSLYNLANVSERVEPLWRVPSGARVRDGLGAIRRLFVVDAKGRRTEAELVGHDIRWGFALLRLKEFAGVSVMPRSAPATALERGRFVITAGDPSGTKSLADPLLTMGILSKLHADTAAAPWRGMWQTDAGAIDGNVGGAAVDLEGRLLGMLTVWDPARHGRNSGIAFIVPWSAIQASIPKLLRGQIPERGLLGITFGRGVSPVIDRVIADSGAAKAGLRAGDVIRSVDGQTMPTLLEVMQIIGQRVEGEHVRLTVERDGHERPYTVVLGARSED